MCTVFSISLYNDLATLFSIRGQTSWFNLFLLVNYVELDLHTRVC